MIECFEILERDVRTPPANSVEERIIGEGRKKSDMYLCVLQVASYSSLLDLAVQIFSLLFCFSGVFSTKSPPGCLEPLKQLC